MLSKSYLIKKASAYLVLSTLLTEVDAISRVNYDLIALILYSEQLLA